VVDEIALAEFAFDELVGGAGVGNPQQCFGEHHQRQPLFGRQRELAQHVLDAAERTVVGSDSLVQPRRGLVHLLFVDRIQPRAMEQPSCGHRARRAG